jgi:hypothetical protein
MSIVEASGCYEIARRHTPRVNGFTEDLVVNNPHLHNPIRLGPSQAVQLPDT